MDTPSPQSRPVHRADDFEKTPAPPLHRRTMLKIGGASAIAATIASVSAISWMPKRVEARPIHTFPDIQFDIGAYVHPAVTTAGLRVQFGVIYTYMAPARLTRTPTKHDQQTLIHALNLIEDFYPFSPRGVFTFVAYGLPYFHRLPARLVANKMPRLAFDHRRFVLEEAVPGPTDVSPHNPRVRKKTFNVPVRIENNDVLFTLRSDSLEHIRDVMAWLQGSHFLRGAYVPSPAFYGLFRFAPARLNFILPGLPRLLAEQRRFSYASEINPASPMWMGFADQQIHASAPGGASVTFAGTHSGHLTTARVGDYFDNGSIIHLSHVIDDLAQFYAKNGHEPEDFSERVQYMFRSKKSDGTPGLPFPQDPHDGFTNGGGLGAPRGNVRTQQRSAFVPNAFFGSHDQASNFHLGVENRRKYRVGHTSGLQRSSRAADGTPLHIRNDGPGLSSLDVPHGSAQPTLEFLVFVPTAEFFRLMRINAASLDYVAKADGGTQASVPAHIEPCDGDDDGLERFLTATRRQNFLVPPRRHRSFPLIELT